MDSLSDIVGPIEYDARALLKVSEPTWDEFTRNVVASNSRAMGALCRAVPWTEEDLWLVLEVLTPELRSLIFRLQKVPAHPMAVAGLAIYLRLSGIQKCLSSLDDAAVIDAAVNDSAVLPESGRAWDMAAALANLPARLDCDAYGQLTWDEKPLSSCGLEERRQVAELLADLYELRR